MNRIYQSQDKRAIRYFYPEIVLSIVLLMVAVFLGPKDLTYSDSISKTITGEIEITGFLKRSRVGEVKFEGILKEENEPKRRVLFRAPELPWLQQVSFEDNQRIIARVKLKCFSLEGLNNLYLLYLSKQGINCQGYIEEIYEEETNGIVRWKGNFIQEHSELTKSDEGALIFSVVLGARDLPSRELKEVFKHLGISHLLVISGFHVGFVFIVAFRLSLFFFSRVKTLIYHVPAQIIASIVALLFATAYTYVAYSGFTAVRALLLLTFVSYGRYLGRRGYEVTLLLATAIIVIILWPGAQFEVGFQLTFSALVGLLLAHKLTEYGEKGFLAKLKNSFIFCFFAWLFTAPVLLYWFGELSLVGPLANFIIIPIFSLLVILFGFISVTLLVLNIYGAGDIFTLQMAILEQIIDVLFYIDSYAMDCGLYMRWSF